MPTPFPFARRIRAVQPSATLAVDAKAKALKAEGKDIIGFGVGEPDFNTPEHIVVAGVKAMQSGDTKYSAKRGAELEKLICAKLERENGLKYAPNQVLTSNGAKHTLYNLLQVLCDEGDEVVIPAPYWVSYLEMVNLAGGKPVILKTDDSTGFKISPEQLESAITPKTRVFLLNSPSNPTGSVYTPDEIKALGKVLEKSGIWAISDEVYEHFIYGDTRHLSLAACSPLLYERTITVNGVSKTFAMTGWRIGYAAGAKEVISAASKLQSHATSAPASFSQAGAAEALLDREKSSKSIATMCVEFDKRRKHMTARLKALSGISCFEPKGAFYCFPKVSGLFGRTLGGLKINSAMDFTQACLEQAGVAVVPGEAFGSNEYIRLSYASSMQEIDKGLDRIEKLVGKSCTH
jgi:aspartate aminotransferase